MSRTPSTTRRHQFGRALAAAALGLFAVFGAASPALAHDELVGTEVVSSDAGAVEGFTLTFSNSIIEVGTEIVATGPDGADVKDGEPEVAGPDVTQHLKEGLPEGDYQIAWRVVSSDGHPIDGAFGISIGADGAGEIVPAAELTEDAETHDHDESHDHAEAEDSAAMPVGVIVAIITGAAVLVIGGITAAVVVSRRKKDQAAKGAAGGE